MTLLSLKAENSRHDGKGIYKAEFSDGTSFLLGSEYLSGEINPVLLDETGQNTGINSELTEQEEEAFRFAAACYRAEKSALRLIARAEQNSRGLKAKLELRGYPLAVVNAVVSRLLDRNLLDDRRFAEHWIRSRLSTGKASSPLQLLVSLGKRGIFRDSSRDAMNMVFDEETEYALLLRYLEKAGIRGCKKAISLKTQLKNQGFSSAVITKYFDEFK